MGHMPLCHQAEGLRFHRDRCAKLYKRLIAAREMTLIVADGALAMLDAVIETVDLIEGDEALRGLIETRLKARRRAEVERLHADPAGGGEAP